MDNFILRWWKARRKINFKRVDRKPKFPLGTIKEDAQQRKKFIYVKAKEPIRKGDLVIMNNECLIETVKCTYAGDNDYGIACADFKAGEYGAMIRK